jgi:hypothetical protein
MTSNSQNTEQLTGLSTQEEIFYLPSFLRHNVGETGWNAWTISVILHIYNMDSSYCKNLDIYCRWEFILAYIP